jgi:superfamily II DNA helicase RecQ
MQLSFFTIPVYGSGEAAKELNGFLTGHRVLAIERHLVQDGANSAWAVCVSFESSGEGRPQAGKRGKVDYREVLNEQDFAVFARLRSLRKELADREGVPAYALFTNEQLSEMVQRRVQTQAALREIPGIGENRVDKYGESFLRLLEETFAASAAKPGPAHEA